METQRRLPTEQIRSQENGTDCGANAIINMYRVLGLEPPTVTLIAENFGVLVAQSPIHRNRRYDDGIGALDTYYLLYALCFPEPFALGAIPVGVRARDVFVPLLNVGCVLIVGYQWRLFGEVLAHAVVVEGYDADGLQAICGGGFNAPDTIVNFDSNFSQTQIDAMFANLQPHGCRCTLPFEPVLRAEGDLGISPYFIIARRAPTSPASG
jgi:hypothetical protein